VKKRVTITDVAAEAGLSIGAVSKVLNGLSVRPDTLERVERAIKKTGYVPNAFARGIRLSDKGNIGILTSPLTHSDWLQDLVFRIVSRSIERGVNFLLETSEGEGSGMPRLLSLVDGVIVIGHVEPQFYQTLETVGAPPVVAYGALPDYGNASAISIDNVQAGRELVNHLVLMGHRRIAFALLPTISAEERLQGYRDVLGECFGAVDESLIVEARDCEDKREVDVGYDLTAQLLEMPNRPTAIVYSTDYVASGGFLAAGEKGLRLPDDISLVAFAGVQGSVETRPALTTMTYDNVSLAETFLDVFHEQARGRKQGLEHLVATFRLEKRDSVRNLNLGV
jgi:LacI family transcriptional regulator